MCRLNHFPSLPLSQLEAKGQAVLDTLELSGLSPSAPQSVDTSLVASGGQDEWGRPSEQGNSPFSDSGSDIDVVVDSGDACHSVTGTGSDSSPGGAAEGGGAKRRGHFLEDDEDDEMDYRSKLAGVKERQVNESESEFVPSGEEEVEVEGEEDLDMEGEEEEVELEGEGEVVEDNVSVQSFSSGGSSEAGAAGQRKMASAGGRRKQGRAVDDDVSCWCKLQVGPVCPHFCLLCVCLCDVCSFGRRTLPCTA